MAAVVVVVVLLLVVLVLVAAVVVVVVAVAASGRAPLDPTTRQTCGERPRQPLDMRAREVDLRQHHHATPSGRSAWWFG